MFADSYHHSDVGNMARYERILTKMDQVYTDDAVPWCCACIQALPRSRRSKTWGVGAELPGIYESTAPALPPVIMMVLPVRDGTTGGFFSLVTVWTAPSTAPFTFATRLSCSEAPAITCRSHQA